MVGKGIEDALRRVPAIVDDKYGGRRVHIAFIPGIAVAGSGRASHNANFCAVLDSGAMTTTEQDAAALRAQLAALVSEAARNETIARRAQRREQLLLQSRSLEDLLENMVGGLRASFGLDAVTLALADPEHEIHHLLLFSQQQRTLPTDGIHLVPDLRALCPHYCKLSAALLGPFDPIEHGRLFDDSVEASGLASVALLPLMLRGKLVGVLNLASRDPSRFTRDHAVDFMNHLGTIAAFCLENAVNRAKLMWSGLTDVLTGWHNRRYLEARLPEEVARARRSTQPLSALIFDLDHFKKVNDRYGHLAGDAALRHAARCAQHVIRASDVAARFGGEEFVLVLPDTPLADARRLAERLAEAIRATPVALSAGEEVPLSVSVGVAALDDADGSDAHIAATSLLERADGAMYAAKQAGRDRVVARQAPDRRPA